MVRLCEQFHVTKKDCLQLAGYGTRRLFSCQPWKTVGVDLVIPLPKTDRGNQWTLVLADHFTRWQDRIALPDVAAPTANDRLDEKVFSYW